MRHSTPPRSGCGPERTGLCRARGNHLVAQNDEPEPTLAELAARQQAQQDRRALELQVFHERHISGRTRGLY